MDFHTFKIEIAKQFDVIRKHDLFVTKVTPDVLWATYLQSFPEGTNPLYRERTEHDCSACRQFIRAVGNIVAVIDGKKVTLWDGDISDPAYQRVAQTIADVVKMAPVENIFLSSEPVIGTEKNFEDTVNGVKTWEHFFVRLPNGTRGEKSCVFCRTDMGPQQAEARGTYEVLARGLQEITLEAIDTVLELIGQNSLYRGEEHQATLLAFRNLKHAYHAVLHDARSSLTSLDDFMWVTSRSSQSQALLRIKNTAIGTLLVDLSAEEDLEQAVRKFEAIMAPQHYQRPTALVTKAMVDAAKKTIEDLGLTSALERRYASLQDITVNNILFANRETRQALCGTVFDEIPTKRDARNFDKVEPLSIDKFVKDVLPECQAIEVMVEPRHGKNFVSLMTAVDPTATLLFKWGNPFSWSYQGDMADAVKERVKQAGGNVTGDLCCRLAWWNHDDLDLHMHEATGGHIYYRHKISSATGGKLDVDMNAGGGDTREPVENIVYDTRQRMQEGVYTLSVHNFHQREGQHIGFEVEIDYLGTVSTFVYEQPVRHGETVDVAEFTYSHTEGITITQSLPASQVSRTLWNVKTHEFRKVNVFMLSPNYWDGQGIGNRHYFFMLDGCQNDGQARGFLNEFLQKNLLPHRKVLEIVGSKMRPEASAEQLSGLGFSSTQRNDVLVRITGSFSRVVRVTF